MIKLTDIPKTVNIEDFKEDFYESFFLTATGRAKLHTPISLIRTKSRGYRGAKKDFFEYFKDEEFSKLKRVIVGEVDELSTIINDVDEIFGNENPFCELFNGNLRRTAFGSAVSEVFNYGDFRDSYQSKKLLRFLNVRTCTYCNCVPTALYEIENNNERALVTYDHFFSQVEYPYLSLSLFNLIPSCPYCNPLKGSASFTPETHVHPYLESLNDLTKFTINGAIPTQEEFEISIEPYDEESKSYLTLSQFEVLQNYNTYKDIIINIYEKRLVNPQEEMPEILARYSNKLGRNITYDEFWELEIGYKRNPNLTLSTVFNKLKRDIAMDFFI